MMELEPSNPEPQKRKLKKWFLILGFAVLLLLLMFLGWFFVRPHFVNNNNIVKEEARKNIDQKVYTVSELSAIIESKPDFFKNKEIKVKAVSINAAPGLGCDDYSIAADLTAEDYNSATLPETIQDRPTINSIGIGEYGIYTGHFFDKNWINQCNKPEIFVTTGYEKIDLDLPTLNKKETVSFGYLIYKGRLLRHPYNIELRENNITVNEVLYETINNNFPSRNATLESSFNSLVKSMQRGDLKIIYDNSEDGGYNRTIPNTGSWKPQEAISQADEIMKSNISKKEKKERLKSILSISNYEEKYLDDMLNNWNK